MTKAQKPNILSEKEQEWLQAVAQSPTGTNRTRYRHPDVKSRLIEETGEKCVYCESNMRPVTSSHIEHKIPASIDESLRFCWENLTIACPECNRRKGAFYNEWTGFLDPYCDDVEARLIHRGPIVGWLPGDRSAELSIKSLGLDGFEREDIIFSKIEKINDIDNLVERYMQEKDGPLGPSIKKRLKAKLHIHAEYSAMVRGILSQSGLTELLA